MVKKERQCIFFENKDFVWKFGQQGIHNNRMFTKQFEGTL